MGMYNEVFAPCSCGSYAEIQIRQIVDGFGDFYLNRPETIKLLTSIQKDHLVDELKDKYFYCSLCDESFTINIERAINLPNTYVIRD